MTERVRFDPENPPSGFFEISCFGLEQIQCALTELVTDDPQNQIYLEEGAMFFLNLATRGVSEMIETVCDAQDIKNVCDVLDFVSSLTGSISTLLMRAAIPQFFYLGIGLAVMSATAKAWKISLERHHRCDELALPPPTSDSTSSPATSPLIIDLNGDGVQTVALEDSRVFFDLNGNGIAQHTAWVSPQDGLLVLDRNGNGRFDNIYELFGSATQDGFSQLAELDDNGDGRIDALDRAFGELRVWVDANADGISQADELRSLIDLGIRMIDVTAQQISEINAGNDVTHESIVETEDGGILEIQDVWFRHSNVVTRVAVPEDFEYSQQAKLLPQLIGYGDVADLRYAMTFDYDLEQAVLALVQGANDFTGARLRAAFETVLLQWTGAADVAADSRGAYIDARHLVAVEQFFATEFLQTAGTNAGTGNPGPNAAAELEQTYQDFVDTMLTRFAVQMTVAQINNAGDDPALANAAFTSPYFSLMHIFYREGSNRLNVVDFNLAVTTAVGTLPDDGAAAIAHLDLVMTALAGLRVDLYGGNADAFKAAMAGALETIADQSLRAFALERLTTVAELTRGGDSDDVIAIAQTPYRDSTVLQQPETNLIVGGAGADVLTGGFGGDSYLFAAGDGVDVVDDRGATDRIVTDDWGVFVNFGGTDQLLFIGRETASAVLSRDGDDLIISFADGSGDSVRVTGQFGIGDSGRIEIFTFADGSISAAEVSGIFTLQAASGGDDAILGSENVDQINGGLGNDVLEGRGGGDTYYYANGDGDDVINDRGSDGGDVVLFAGIAAGDVAVVRDGDDALISILTAASGSLRLVNQFAADDASRIEAVRFADGTVWTQTDLVIAATGGLPQGAVLEGTPAGELVTGTAANDLIDGGAGDDTIDGGAGTDMIMFGAGSGRDVLVTSRQDRFAEANIVAVNAVLDDLLLERNGDDLMISLLERLPQPDGSTIVQATGDSLRVMGHFLDAAAGIDRIVFADASSIDADEINAIAHPDTTTMRLEGVTLVELSFGRADAPIDRAQSGGFVGADLVISANGAVLAQIADQFFQVSGASGEVVSAGIELLQLDDGTVLDRAALAALAPLDGTPYNDRSQIGGDGLIHRPLVGTDAGEAISGFGGDDIIVGGAGNDTINGGTGDDRLTGDGDRAVAGLVPREGSDSYVYFSGDGNDLIVDLGSGAVDFDRLILGDLARADVAIERVAVTDATGGIYDAAADLVITILATGEAITVDRQFENDLLGLEQIQFAGGGVMNRLEFTSDVALVGTAGNDRINGEGLIDPGLGDDFVYAAAGSAVDAIFLYASGDGNDFIHGINIVRLGELRAADIRLEREGDGNLEIVVNATGERIWIYQQFEPEMVDGDGFDVFVPSLTSIEFADGEVWLRDRIEDEAAAYGSDGDDFIEAEYFSARIAAGDGNDSVFGGYGSDTLTGGAGDDVLTGSFGNDTFIAGGAGAAGSDGDDTIDGGYGRDVYDASGAIAAVFVDIAAGTAAGADIGNDSLSDIEGVIGGRGNDSLSAGANSAVLDGREGDDSLIGGDGDDVLTGGQGADVLSGGEGIDTADYSTSRSGIDVDLERGTGLFGDAAGDQLSAIEQITGTNHGDVIAGDAGDNYLELGGGADLAFGRDGDDVIEGGRGSDTIDGGAGDDNLYGDLGADELFGGDGDDVLEGASGSDRLEGGAGSDIYEWYYGDGSDVIVELAGDSGDVDQLALYDVDPSGVVLARVGDDLVLSFLSGERLRIAGQFSAAGSGIEEIYFDDEGLVWDTDLIALEAFVADNSQPFAVGNSLVVAAGTPATISAASLLADDADFDGDNLVIVTVQDAVNGTVGFDNDGNVVFTPDAAFAGLAFFTYTLSDGRGGTATGLVDIEVEATFISGGEGNDRLTGAAGSDFLEGRGGRDYLVGGAGADRLDGGAGRDVADYYGSDAGVQVDLETGLGAGGDAEGDVLIDIEILVGSRFGDALTGDFESNTLIGYDGDDSLSGGAGADYLRGDEGADTLDGGSGLDTADYIRSDAGVVIDLDLATASGGHADGDVLVSIENVHGSNYGDDLSGTDAANIFRGLDGDDSLSGRGGNDYLIGGAGADVIDGGSGRDIADYAESDAGIMIELALGLAGGGHAEGDQIIGIESLYGSGFGDSLIGDGEANTLIGRAGDDLLSGGGGADYLNGGAGNDSLSGGGGSDQFVFQHGSGHDEISDFATQSDLVVIFGSGQSAVDVLANAVDHSFGTVITISPDQTITFLGLSAATLDVDDFRFF